MNKKNPRAWNNTEELDIIITPIQIDGFSWFTAGLTNETINENINILKSQSQPCRTSSKLVKHIKGWSSKVLRHDPRSFNKSAKNIDVDKHNQSVKNNKNARKKAGLSFGISDPTETFIMNRAFIQLMVDGNAEIK
jgi:hypothetical protein